MRAGMIVGMVLMLAGCGRLPFGHSAVLRGGETITYSFNDGALCGLGTCRSYTVTLGPDRQGIFSGADGRDRRFLASTNELRNFSQALASARPKGELLLTPKEPGCRRATADGTVVDVRWQPAEQPPAHLRVFSGCTSAKARKLDDRLRGLPVSLLPLQPFLGSD